MTEKRLRNRVVGEYKQPYLVFIDITEGYEGSRKSDIKLCQAIKIGLTHSRTLLHRDGFLYSDYVRMRQAMNIDAE